MQQTTSQDQSEVHLIAEVGLIEVVAQWCECLHGREPLSKSLEVFARGLGAEIVALVRYSCEGGASVRTVNWDRAVVEGHASRSDRGFARSLIGTYFEAARPGSLWFRSMTERGASADLEEFHAARHMRELAIIPLDSSTRFIDTFEIHFQDRLRNCQQLILNSLAPVLARTWHNRARGLFTESLLRVTPSTNNVDLVPILSIENPARLSRAEYRVSLLLSRGLSIPEVKLELLIRESTLRSHLSNLYAKTNCSNLSELIFRLTSPAPVRENASRQAKSA